MFTQLILFYYVKEESSMRLLDIELLDRGKYIVKDFFRRLVFATRSK